MSYSIVSNSILNLSSFAIVGIVNIVQVSLIVSNYGVEEYGIVVFFKLMLPTGILALLDFGVSESVTRYVSYNRDNSSILPSYIYLSIIVIVLVSLVVSIVFMQYGSRIIDYINSDNLSSTEAIEFIVEWISYMIAILYIGVIYESILKGMTDFAVIRGTEIVSSLVNTLGVFIISMSDGKIKDIILMLLVVLVARYFIIAMYSHKKYTNLFRFDFSIDRGLLSDYFSHCKQVFFSKVISLIPNYFAQVLITMTSGVENLGIYDVIMKIPKMIKTVIGKLNSVIFPYISRMYGGDKSSEVPGLVLRVCMYQAYVFVPVLLLLWINADFIIDYWVGEELVKYTQWFKLMLVWVFLSIYVGVWSSVALSKKVLLKRMNVYSLYLSGIYCLLTSVLVYYFGIVGVFVSTLLSMLIVFPFIVRFFTDRMGFEYSEYYTPVAKVATVSSVPVALTLLYNGELYLTHLMLIVVSLFLSWFLVYIVLLDGNSRSFLNKTIKSMLVRK